MMASPAAAAPLPSQKELEEMLIESGIELSTPPSSTGELLSLLEKVESELKSIGQDPSMSTRNLLEPIKKALIETKLLRHSEKIIDCSVASCICEIIRISAPVLPYDNTEMEVFNTFYMFKTKARLQTILVFIYLFIISFYLSSLTYIIYVHLCLKNIIFWFSGRFPSDYSIP
ncbi:PREDICTED: uncharacterized protein LOC109165345 [Ipomoea nil]|uniref:uncharacterized protein LOC109165345 n=1 Tax=Ipomoea nil TaxID=35883 RepID=UPI0009016EB3|nr:PREDICTED: uncharacterized protein LOC109165345 [Ipomoea nil]